MLKLLVWIIDSDTYMLLLITSNDVFHKMRIVV